jgi:hypothetical protein
MTLGAPARFDLGDLLPALAGAAAQTQAVMDRGWDEDTARWGQVVAQLCALAPPERAAELASLLAPIAPVRQVVHRYEVDLRAQVQVAQGRRFGVGVRPLELGWEAVYGAMRESAARFVLTVGTVPLAAAPDMRSSHPSTDAPPFDPSRSVR